MPRVSVIIPTYNRAKYISEAIGSIMSQTYNDYEIIVVDDGSTDNTKEVLKKYKEKIKYVCQKNQGSAAARNRGVKESRGEFIAFVDSDDLLMPRCFELQVQALEKNPQAAFAYGKSGLVDEGGRCIKKIFSTKKRRSGNIFEDLLFGSCIRTDTAMFRKACFNDIGGYDKSLLRAQDWDMYLRMCKKYEVVFIDEVVAQYRYHGSNSVRDTEMLLNFVLKIMNKHKGCFKDHPHRSHIYSEYGWEFIQKGRKERGKELILESLKLDPEQLFNPQVYQKWIFGYVPFEKRNNEAIFSTLVSSKSLILELMDEFYSLPDLRPKMLCGKKRAYAVMEKVFGMYYYLSRNNLRALKSYMSALVLHPASLAEKEASFTMLKSLIPNVIFRLFEKEKDEKISVCYN